MKIYNTLTRQKELFEPKVAGKVNMYVCGPTVYNYIHVGNARTFLSFDVIRRYLEWRGYDVSFIQNITDIDDKIIARAAEEGRSFEEVAQFYTDAFIADMRSVGVEDPTVRPKATESIPQMIELIEDLIKGDNAYATEEGDVYFAVRSFPDYGKLSGRDVDELMHGTRKEVDDQKRDPLDFALWKAAKPGEPFWDSPWGKGRPGWHIECSAMSDAELGIPFDIHGGGVDLVFPHHENEIAQTEAATGKEMAHYWMHSGMLQTSGEKMSKSLGNFMLLHDLLKEHEPNVVRLLMLQTHYRSPLDFSDERLKEATTSLGRIQTLVDRAAFVLKKTNELKAKKRRLDSQMFPSAASTELQSMYREAVAAYQREMDDDFNTAGAVGQLFELVRGMNTFLDVAAATEDSVLDEDELVALQAAYDSLIELFGVLGVVLTSSAQEAVNPQAEALLEERTEARATKDWARADEIRDELAALGYEIKDTAQGPQLVKKA
ncbi:MAG: cysteine--tRNA ligase [Coriobacteriia bacterium]|nr:cysteine--tRNA ligase [Coriobacteriia bacterium]MCL2870453.1 cysteine--tRNA ligase [Coriobacteriia bacterium]